MLERNIVVEILHRRAPLAAPAATAGTRGAVLFSRRLLAIAAAVAPDATAVEHGELAAVALEDDLGRVALLPGIVGPFARLKRAFEINLGALLEVLLDHLDEALVEDDDAVPLGLFLALAAGLVAPAVRSRDRQIGDAEPILGRADFRITA